MSNGLLFLPEYTHTDIKVYTGVGSEETANGTPQIWLKPPGKRMVYILAQGKGGDGGAGVIGANSAAAGGGGGGAGAFVAVMIPACQLPDILYVFVGSSSTVQGPHSIVSMDNSITGYTPIVYAPAGRTGSAGSGATGGAGATAVGASFVQMPLGWAHKVATITGQAGGAGGGTGTATGVSLPTTGGRTMGGGGGAGLGASGAAGTAGAGMIGSGIFPTVSGGAGGSTATTPPVSGSRGLLIGDFFHLFGGQAVPRQYGGCGGGSTHGTATGAGLVQASGGDGGWGSGGGGSGGALTGSTAGKVGKGGPGFVIILAW